MQLITRAQKAAEAAEEWKKQYFRNGSWAQVIIGDTERKYIALQRLGATPIPDDVDEAIGNNSWTRIICNECGRDDVPAVVLVGEEPDYESCTASICPDCISKAAGLVKS